MKDIEQIDCNAMDTYKEENPMPFWDRKVTLIAFDKHGNWWATKSIGGKTSMIKNKEKSDTFCCAWTGQYSTNIFRITQPELKSLIKKK